MKTILVYMTTENIAEAEKISKALVSKRLAACANIIDGIKSFYHWKGRIENSKEAVIIAKTTSDLLEPLTSEVKKLHSYECPCITAFEISGGNEDYLSWITESVKKIHDD